MCTACQCPTQGFVGTAVTAQLCGLGKMYMDSEDLGEGFQFVKAHGPMKNFLAVHDATGAHFEEYWNYEQVRV